MGKIEIRTQKRSWAERHPIRSAVLYTTLTVGFIVFLATGGIALVTQLASILENTRQTDVTPANDNSILSSPTLDPMPFVTNQKNLTLSGTAQSGATVRVTVNGNPSDFISNSSGKFNADVSLLEGANTIKAQTVDGSGNHSIEIGPYTITVDTNEPVLTISSPTDGQTFSGKKDQTITITGNVDKQAQVTVNDRIIIVSSDGSFSYNYTLNEGENQLLFKAKDNAGNEVESTVKVNYNP